jgi:ABC-type multidrug transport system fused ATPase/permease subunit
MECYESLYIYLTQMYFKILKFFVRPSNFFLSNLLDDEGIKIVNRFERRANNWQLFFVSQGLTFCFVVVVVVVIVIVVGVVVVVDVVVVVVDVVVVVVFVVVVVVRAPPSPSNLLQARHGPSNLLQAPHDPSNLLQERPA